MTRLRLLADDLTGALDSAARFVPLVGPVATTWQPGDTFAAFDAGTRDLPEPAAREAMARFAPLLADGDPAFKKIDSLLRGHVALELTACMRHFDRCVLAPAFPFQGRITRGGRQLVREGDAWRDVGVDLRALGTSIHVYDAETDADLDAIVAAERDRPGRVLWCGTGGLAAALAGRSPMPRSTLPLPVLALIGTDHKVSRMQLQAVPRLRAHERDAVARALAAGFAAVCVELPGGTSRNAAHRAIIEHFMALLAAIERPGTLMLAGGETLRALCRALRATHLEVDGEIEPGVPTSVLRGGAWDGQRIVSKSGAFGGPDFLARLAAFSPAPPAG